jgi:hypothetical protein
MSRFRVEVVSHDLISISIFQSADGTTAINGRIRLNRITSHKKFKSITSLIIGHDKPSTRLERFLALATSSSYRLIGSRMPSRKFVPYNVCGGTVVSRSARRRTRHDKTRRASSVHMIQPRHTQDPRATDDCCALALSPVYLTHGPD